jgi:hypothetical protein
VKALFFIALFVGAFVPAKLHLEHAAAPQPASAETLRSALDPRERIGQTAVLGVLGGFRAIVADFLFIDAHFAWERTDWAHLLMRVRQVTMLQPHVLMFWDIAAWHMAWNAGTAALNDETKPLAARQRLQREYIEIGRDFLERGVGNNPTQPQLYEALARLYRDKLQDHARAAENFDKASRLPGCASYDERFAAYEISYCAGREREAYEKLRALYERGEKERLPALVGRLRAMEERLNIPAAERIADH